MNTYNTTSLLSALTLFTLSAVFIVLSNLCYDLWVRRAMKLQINRVVRRYISICSKYHVHCDSEYLRTILYSIRPHPPALQRLATACEADFVRDVFGLLRHYDGSTGEIGGGFIPRFTNEV